MDESTKQRRIIRKLLSYQQRLLAGERLQIHGLMPVLGLLQSDEESRKYAAFIIKQMQLHLRQPINPVMEMPRPVKQHFLVTLQELLAHKSPISDTQIKQLQRAFKPYYGGSKRLYVHADRAKYADADVGVIGAIMHCFDNVFGVGNIHFRRSRHHLYQATQYFCCDYKDYRYKPNEKSADRVLAIASYFDALYPSIDLRVNVS